MRLIPLAVWMLMSGTAVAGEHDIHLETGVTVLSRTDTQFSPLTQTGVVPRFGLGWALRGDKFMHKANVAVSLGEFGARDFDFLADGETRNSGPSVITMADVQYAGGARINSELGTFHVGATSANHAEDLVFVNGIVGVSHYIGAFEVGPWVDWRLEAGKRVTFGVEAWVPAVAWTARNPYAIHSGEHLYNTRDHNTVNTIVRHIGSGSLHTVDVYQAVHVRPSVQVALADHWTLSTRARLDLFHHAKPYSVVESQIGLDVALHGRF